MAVTCFCSAWMSARSWRLAADCVPAVELVLLVGTVATLAGELRDVTIRRVVILRGDTCVAVDVSSFTRLVVLGEVDWSCATLTGELHTLLQVLVVASSSARRRFRQMTTAAANGFVSLLVMVWHICSLWRSCRWRAYG